MILPCLDNLLTGYNVFCCWVFLSQTKKDSPKYYLSKPKQVMNLECDGL